MEYFNNFPTIIVKDFNKCMLNGTFQKILKYRFIKEMNHMRKTSIDP